MDSRDDGIEPDDSGNAVPQEMNKCVSPYSSHDECHDGATELSRHLTSFGASSDARPSSLPITTKLCETAANLYDQDVLRYAEISKFKSDSNANINNKSQRRSDSSICFALQRLTSFNTGGPTPESEAMDDDLAPLLPNNRELSQEEIYHSHTSLVSSSDGGMLATAEDTSSESQETDNSINPTCILGLVERLLRTHPVWFLPGIQRSGAVHLLQGKEEGNFIVRGSSQSKTMAVSVRLPADTGPYIEHYLIQSNDNLLSLESSQFTFDSIPSLIAHYSQCCDELPVQLCLPRALRDAKNRQQLSSLALLGQEFWRYPMASPKPKTMLSATSSHMNTPSEATQSSGIGVSVLNHSYPAGATPIGGAINVGETPTDTFSMLSSFTASNGQQLLSPESIDSAIMISPMDATHTGIVGKTSTFKSKKQVTTPATASYDVEKQIEILNASLQPQTSLFEDFSTSCNNVASDTIAEPTTLERRLRAPRPTPPNTLNIKPIRSPPAPPARRANTLATGSPTAMDNSMFTSNITVTTTVTFTVDNQTNTQLVELVSPSNSNSRPGCNSVHTAAVRMPPDGECVMPSDNCTTTDVFDCDRGVCISSTGPSNQVLSCTRISRRNKRKESKHYQESDILESPSVYCRSNLGDKISDYEDLWCQEANNTNKMSSFKQTNKSSHLKTNPFSHSKDSINYVQNQTISLRPSHLPQLSLDNSSTLTYHGDSMSDRSTPTEKNRTILKTFSPTPTQEKTIFNPMLEPRHRLGIMVSNSTPTMDVLSTVDVDPSRSPGESLKFAQCESKQASPFYADPADIFSSIVRRSPLNRSRPASSSQRHSEPPKQVPVGSEPQKTAWVTRNGDNHLNNLASSLDELKTYKPDYFADYRNNAKTTVSSTAHSVHDYDSDLRWKPIDHLKLDYNNATTDKKVTNNREHPALRPITVQQIIAKRLPHLNLSETIGCLQAVKAADTNGSKLDQLGAFLKTQRKSAYDNVERTISAYATSALNSAQSDDGTVFSEPWDSSQWDTFLPDDQQCDNLSTTTNSKCNPSGSNLKLTQENSSLHRDQRKKEKECSVQKVATILRTRSCRDREILCHPRNKPVCNGPGETIAAYTLRLANETESTFSRNISNFISCTKESKAAPQVIMRNMRQFMSGMKNYLVKHGEGDFASEVQKARAHLKSDEFLNLDSILEEVMHKLVILPLREHLYGLFVDHFTRAGDIQLLVEKVKQTAGRTPAAFGVKYTVIPPNSQALRHISTLFVRLQEAELPLIKLDLLLTAVSTIFEATSCNGQQLSADDFLPVLVMVVAHCGFIGAEIEAEYMWGLIQPSLLSGEAGYYLTALCSAVHVLKNFSLNESEGNATLDWGASAQSSCSSVLRVIIPDEYNGSIQTRTLPIRPHTTTREVCRIIAHKARITNAQDYGLFKLIDGEETLLQDTECPQDVRMTARGKHCMIAYKRIDAKIAWPTAMPNSASDNQLNA